jgi:hypothetical protein
MRLTIVPLDNESDIWALLDENGITMGTGTREVCEGLLCIISKPFAPSIFESVKYVSPARLNIRSAMSM